MGLVFQFPERHFIGASLAQELTLGWPRGDPADTYSRQMVAANVLQAVGLMHVPLDTPLHTLSDGYKRYGIAVRCVIAVWCGVVFCGWVLGRMLLVYNQDTPSTHGIIIITATGEWRWQCSCVGSQGCCCWMSHWRGLIGRHEQRWHNCSVRPARLWGEDCCGLMHIGDAYTYTHLDVWSKTPMGAVVLDQPYPPLHIMWCVAPHTGKLKQERPVLMVSHDLREIAPHVTHAWRMLPGGVLQPSDLAAV